MLREWTARMVLALLVAVAISLVPGPGVRVASATDGHLLHGVGAVNSAMGGAGVGRPTSLMGTYYLNPAGLMKFRRTQIEFGFELFKPNRSVSSGFGNISGETESKSDWTPIPAMAFSMPVGDRAVVGLAGVGIGGFGVDYPGDLRNPILAPRPLGFGPVFSDYQLMSFMPAVAWEVNERLWLGASVHINWASLAVDPLPVAAPAVDPGPDGIAYTHDDRAFYSRATSKDGSFGFGLHVGMMYALSDSVDLGVAYSTTQWFQDFSFQAAWENPHRPDFGMAREVSFGLDLPAVLGVGVGWQAMPEVGLAFDARRIFYGGTDGFSLDGPPFDERGAVKGFGWESIWVLAGGAEWQVNDRWTARGGYNYSQNPIPDRLSFFNVPAPGIVQHHLTLGAGYQVSSEFGIDLAYYKAFENSGTGPMWNLQGPIPGTFVTNRLQEDSVLMQFTFTPGR